MRRLLSLPQMCTWMIAAAAAFANVHSSSLLAQSPALPPRVASITSAPATNAPAAQPQAAPAIDPLLTELDRAIELTSKRLLTANSHSPWQIFHGILAMKRDFQLKLGEGKVNAIEWIATSESRFDNQPLLLKTPHGAKFHPYTRMYAFEGHPAQFMALMSQSNLPADYKFKIGQEQVPLSDLINNIMKEVNSKEEVTWVLWTLQHYLRSDAQWVNQFNEPWSIEKLVQIEAAAPVNGAACGGNHRLFALTRARDKHLARGGRLEGVWAEADLKIRQHVELARQLQNSDGSFSAKFYEAPGVTNDANKRFNTTGHTLEFLSIGVPTHRLNEQWLRNAAAVLSRELVYNANRPIDCGPLYHTLNSLMIYRDRLREHDAGWLAARAASASKVEADAPIVATPVRLKSEPVPTTPPAIAGTPGSNGASPVPSVSLSTMPKLAALPKPIEDTKPVAIERPIEPAKPTEVPMPAEISKPVEGVKPAEIAKPMVPAPTTPAVPAEKQMSVRTPDETIPSVIKPSQGSLTQAIKRPEFARSVTILRTISPGRVVQFRPVEQPLTNGRPALLPDVTATPLDGLDLPIGNEQESFDSAPGTLKPRFEVPPRASRINTPKPAAMVEPLLIPPPLDEVSDDEPASALRPANHP